MIETFSSFIEDKNKEYVIFDVGSRDCVQSIEFYNTFPNSKIYAFECNPNTLSICKQNIQKYFDRITLIEGAVCDYNGEITFYPINQKQTTTTWMDGNPGASSIFKSNGTYNVEHYVQDEIKTNCHRLDTIIETHSIKGPDIIWMDLQGAELLALQGLGAYMNRVSYIHTEVSYKEMYTGQVMFNELNTFILNSGFTLKNNLSLKGWQEDVIYEKKSFDIVIPIGPNDIDVVENQVNFTKQNIIGYNNIYLVYKDTTLQVEGCTTIPESIFPFSLTTVSQFHGERKRNNWYFQQLLKLYSFLIPNILDTFLILDSDTFFLQPTTFVSGNKCLYNTGTEYHIPYFKHMEKVHPEFKKVHQHSGICHHMMFEKRYILEMFSMVESKHNDLFYNVFLQCVSESEYDTSGASEYEMYFNYMVSKHPDKIIIRNLKFGNVSGLTNSNVNVYESCHWYARHKTNLSVQI